VIDSTSLTPEEVIASICEVARSGGHWSGAESLRVRNGRTPCVLHITTGGRIGGSEEIMTESFAQMLEESFSNQKTSRDRSSPAPSSREPRVVIVNAGLK
jgi:hypothetical protein